MEQKTYKHLTQSDRDRIELLLKAGHKQKEVAEVLGVHKSTISREIGKHKRIDGRYDSCTAEHKAYVKRLRSKYQGMKVESLPNVKRHIIRELENKRSPDEIAGRLSLVNGKTVVGKDAIYRWLYSVWGQRYCTLLCTKRYKKRKQKRTSKRELIPNRIPLNERPKRGIHWQGDLFVSPQKMKTTSSVALLCEEKSQYLVGTKIPNRKPTTMLEAVKKLAMGIRANTLTLDNGIENRSHEQFPFSSFFCDAHSPWQKPHIENNIGLVRRWFIKKGTDLRTVSESQLQEYIAVLNGKYRKSLGYRSAYEVALENGSIKQSLVATVITRLSQNVALHRRI